MERKIEDLLVLVTSSGEVCSAEEHAIRLAVIKRSKRWWWWGVGIEALAKKFRCSA